MKELRRPPQELAGTGSQGTFNNVNFVVSAPANPIPLWQGFGFELDPWAFSPNMLAKGFTEPDWALLTGRLASMKLGFARVMVMLEWVQTVADGPFDWTGQQATSLFRYLDFLQEQNIDIVLVEWGFSVTPLYGGAPADPVYARNLVNFLKELVLQRGYTKIKYFTSINEPDTVFIPTYGMPAYVTLYQNLRSEMNAAGLTGTVQLVAADMIVSISPGGLFEDAITQLYQTADAWSIHRYPGELELLSKELLGPWETLWSRLMSPREFLNAFNPGGRSKLYLVNEAGITGGASPPAIIEEFRYGIHMATYGVTALNSECNGVCAWIAFNLYYFESSDPFENTFGSMKGIFATPRWGLRPWAVAWTLLSRTAPRGSRIFAVNGTPPTNPGISLLHGAAIKRPGGEWNLFVVNRQTAITEDVNVTLPEIPARDFEVYRYDADSGIGNLILAPVGIQARSSTFTFSVPPETMIVLNEQSVSMPPIRTTAHGISESTLVRDF